MPSRKINIYKCNIIIFIAKFQTILGTVDDLNAFLDVQNAYSEAMTGRSSVDHIFQGMVFELRAVVLYGHYIKIIFLTGNIRKWKELQ